MLSNGNQDGCMVGRRVDRRKLVCTRRKTIGHIDGHNAFRVRRSVDALEERKLGRVRGLRRVDGVQFLDDTVGVPDDGVLCVQLLGTREVVGLCVGETSRLEMIEHHLDLELGVCLDCAKILGVDELAGRHVRRGCDDTHRGGTTRTVFDLLSVRKWLVNGVAKVDEVVLGG